MRWVAILLAVLLTGCAQIPDEGPVEEVSLPSDPQGIDIAPQPPAEDAEAAQVLEGFLLAMTEPEGDYAIARSYLTEEASAGWDPGASTTVYVGGIEQARPDEPASYRLQGTTVGRVDSTGRFAPGAGSFAHDFTLVDVDGQWRISTPPEDLLVSRYLFDRLYTPLTLYFIALGGDHVIPDLISWPEQLVTPTRIVEALLDGPGERLVGSATNAIPSGVRLGDEDASIDAQGVVTIDFAGLDDSMGDEDRRELGAQLLWSLTALPRVTGVRVTNEGVPFILPGQSADGVLELATHQNYQVLARAATQELYGVQEAVPGQFTTANEFEPLMPEMPRSSELAISLDGSLYAVVSEDRSTLYQGPMDGDLAAVAIPGGNIRDVQFVLGELYVLADDETGRTRVFSVGTQGDVEEIGVDLPTGLSLESVAFSQAGGTGAVLAAREGELVLGEVSVFLGSDLRDFREVPVVGPSGSRVRDIVDVEWGSESTWVVTGVEEGDHGVYVVRSDGAQVEELGSFDMEVARVAALPRQGGGLISLLTTSGQLWRYESPNRWADTNLFASSITYAG